MAKLEDLLRPHPNTGTTLGTKTIVYGDTVKHVCPHTNKEIAICLCNSCIKNSTYKKLLNKDD
jgi:hypothetical protein